MKNKLQYNSKVSHILFILIIGIMLLNGAYTLHSIISEDQQSHTRTLLVSKSNEILNDINLLNATLGTCSSNNETCSSAAIQLLVEELNLEIARFQSIVSREKSLASLTGTLGFDLLQLHIKEYKQTLDSNKLATSIKEASNTSIAIINSLLANYSDSNTREDTQTIYKVVAINALLLCVFILFYFRNARLIKHIEVERQRAHATFKTISNNLKTIDQEKVKERISNITTTSIEKNIYAKLLTSYEQLEAQKSQTDLYQRLYNLLGYEIRGITNTIQGGVKLLVKDSDENGALLAKEIISATRTLENLADNFNRISNIDSSNTEKTINFYNLVSELIVLGGTKSKQHSKHIECFVENTIPQQMHGNQTGLFWILLLQISNRISASPYSNVLLHVGCSGSQQVDKLTITFTLYFYDEDYETVDHVEGLDWDSASNKDITNTELSNNLLNGIKNYQATLHTIEKAEKVAISFDVHTSHYTPLSNRLAGKTILLCGTANIHLDILQKILISEGAKVVIANTANDIFMMMKDLNANDGIFLTDHIKGITLDSFCKTLKARLSARNIKLMMSMSNSVDIDDIYNHVDYIFYHPFTPTDFIEHIVKTLESVGQEEEKLASSFLIVEDDRVQQIILNKILSGFDFQCQGVDDGEKAVSLIKEQDFDIIFMDCIMPNMGGIDATLLIRQYEKENGLPPTTIIGATALKSNKEHKRCIDAGMDYVISKPYKNEEIYSVIKKYMAIRKVG